MACARNHLIDVARRDEAEIRKPPQPIASLHPVRSDDGQAYEPSAADSPEEAFHAAWRRNLLERAMAAVQQEAIEKDRAQDFQIFLDYYANDNPNSASWSEIAERHGLERWKQAVNKADWVKRQLSRAIRDEIRRYGNSEVDVDDGLRDSLGWLRTQNTSQRFAAMNTPFSKLSDSKIRSLLSLGFAYRALRVGDFLLELPEADRAAAFRDVLDDLNTPVGALSDGPAGLLRLTHLPSEEAENIQRMALLEVVAEDGTSRAILNSLAQYGDLLLADVFPEQSRLAGGILSALAKLALKNHWNIKPNCTF